MRANSISQQADAKQCRIQSFAFVISVGVCVFLCVGFLSSGLCRWGQPGEIELDEKINPNSAALGSLMRLPGIGRGRGEAIVSYREEFSLKGNNRAAFESIDDLQKVSGIGPKTVENIGKWLKFE
jgi:competence ComEA-like helix-hairpin-helix protein